MAKIRVRMVDLINNVEHSFTPAQGQVEIRIPFKKSKGYRQDFGPESYSFEDGKSLVLKQGDQQAVFFDESFVELLADFRRHYPTYSTISVRVEPELNRFQTLIKSISDLFGKEDTSHLEPIPNYEEGYDEASNTIVRFAGKKAKKPYQVSGIEDVASKNNWKGWIYLAPIIILIAVFSLYPLVNTIFISFTSNYKYATGEFDGLTLKNFSYILGLTPNAAGGIEKHFLSYALLNTVIVVFVTVPVSIVLALLISVALNSIKWLKGFLQTIFFIPYVTNAIAIGMVFSVIFDRNGVINFLFHLDYAWVKGVDAERWRAMIPLCIYIVWHSLPYKILIFLSGLQGIDKQYYQAAQIDSCPKWKVLLRITVPLLSPQILYIMITSFIGAFKEYSSVVGLFNGPGLVNSGGKSSDPCMETVVFYVYDNMHSNTSAAAAAAVFLFVIILLFTFFQFKVSKKRVHY